MKPTSLQEIAQLSHAKLVGCNTASAAVTKMNTDTRTLRPGDVYVPLIGENLDGHRFIEQAFEKGAVASFIDTQHEKQEGKCYLEVEDTTVAYQTLAKNYCKALDLTIIGITGSNGKTTTKDIMYSVMKQKLRTNKTKGNLNNHIGVPKTLLELEEDTQVAVVEMGMDHPGEIDSYVQMAPPHFALITNVGFSHLAYLKTKENVAKAKLEITNRMTEDDVFLYNYDDPVLRKEVLSRNLRPKIITFGQEKEADYRLQLIHSDAKGSVFRINEEEYSINLLGSYQMYNAAGAIIIAKIMGFTKEEIQRGLHVQDATAMRQEMIHCDGFDILNDCYNANPQSMAKAFETMRLLAGYRRKIAILGDMLELGEEEEDLHRTLGESINPLEVDYVLLYGNLAKKIEEGAKKHFPENRIFHFDSKPDLVDKAKYLITKNTLVLVKASRGLRLEEVIESLKDITALY